MTLVEIARLEVRTVQRVESGKPSSVDTRRALARAFDWEDIDIFNKAVPLPNVERLRKKAERLKQKTVVIPCEPIRNGRELREIVDIIQGCQFSQIVDLPENAQRTFAQLQEYFQEYAECDELYTPTQKLDVNNDFQQMLDRLAKRALAS
jgi:hypothetical protein